MVIDLFLFRNTERLEMEPFAQKSVTCNNNEIGGRGRNDNQIMISTMYVMKPTECCKSIENRLCSTYNRIQEVSKCKLKLKLMIHAQNPKLLS